jgi:hypothetical protein
MGSALLLSVFRSGTHFGTFLGLSSLKYEFFVLFILFIRYSFFIRSNDFLLGSVGANAKNLFKKG